jgi:hypothetical protein
VHANIDSNIKEWVGVRGKGYGKGCRGLGEGLVDAGVHWVRGKGYGKGCRSLGEG